MGDGPWKQEYHVLLYDSMDMLKFLQRCPGNQVIELSEYTKTGILQWHSDIAHPTALGLTPFGGSPLNHSIMLQPSWGGVSWFHQAFSTLKHSKTLRAGPGERGQTPELACGGAFTNGTRTPHNANKTPATYPQHTPKVPLGITPKVFELQQDTGQNWAGFT